jgi:acyl carrier protein
MNPNPKRIQRDPKIIAEQLCQFARANLVANAATLNEHTPLAEAGIDSFSLVELLVFSERAFGIAIPESHLTQENLASLAALAGCIAALDGGGGSCLPASG